MAFRLYHVLVPLSFLCSNQACIFVTFLVFLFFADQIFHRSYVKRQHFRTVFCIIVFTSYRFFSKFPTSIPVLFIWESFPPGVGGGGEHFALIKENVMVRVHQNLYSPSIVHYITVHSLRNRKHVPCFYRVIQTRVEVWENEKCCGNTSRRRVFPQLFRVLPNFHECLYNSIETRRTCFPFLSENNATRKRKTTC